MTEYAGPDRKLTDRIIREAGIVTVMGRALVADSTGDIRPDYVVAAVNAIWDAKLPAELTFRLPQSVLEIAVDHLKRERLARYERGQEVVLGVGSIQAYSELEQALNLGFDFVVSPGSGVGGEKNRSKPGSPYHDPIEFVKLAHDSDVFAAPATQNNDGLAFYLFRNDSYTPDAIKIFNSALFVNDVTGDVKKLAGLLAPSVRSEGRYKNAGYVIMPTGAVNRWSAPLFIEAIKSNGFYPVLGMSDPLVDMKKRATANKTDYARSIDAFKEVLRINKEAYARDPTAYMTQHAAKII